MADLFEPDFSFVPWLRVMSLPGSARRKGMCARLQAMGVKDPQTKFFDAIKLVDFDDAKTHRPECASLMASRSKFYHSNNDRYILNAMGCFFSHVGIIEEARRLNQPFVVVFEDDVEVKRKWTKEEKDTVQAFLKDGEWDIFFFGASRGQGTFQNTDFQSIKKCSGLNGGFAYAVHARYYDRYIENAWNVAARPIAEIDQTFSRDTRAKQFCLVPGWFHTTPGVSEIENKQTDYRHCSI